MTAFRGNHPAKIDDKGRLKLPAAFKDLLDAANVAEFFVTSPDGASAEIWPLAEWEKREEKLDAASEMDESVRKYRKWTSYYGQQVQMDSQARIVLPMTLRNAARLDGEVAVCGMKLYLEVVNREVFEKAEAAERFTADDRMALAPMLRRQS